jgi:hypothetical protein
MQPYLDPDLHPAAAGTCASCIRAALCEVSPPPSSHCPRWQAHPAAPTLRRAASQRQVVSPSSHVVSPVITESLVISTCQALIEEEKGLAIKRIIAGAMLIEFRHHMMSCHADNSSANWHDRTKTCGFKDWLERNEIPQRSAYRWMENAEIILRKRLGLSGAEAFSPVIDIGGESIPISQALTAPDSDLSADALNFKQGLFQFMADKTIAEAVRASLDGESPAHRISRAANGKLHGGAPDIATDPEARKNFPKFIASNLKKLNGNLAGWERWRKNNPAQYQQVAAIFRSVINGGNVQVDESGASTPIAPWPRSLCELIADLLKERLRKHDA